MNILGISCYYHDAAAALVRDGQLIAAAEEERFSRVKHDFGFPLNAIRFCLQRGGITGDELDYIIFYERPFTKFERVLTTSIQTFPKSFGVFRESMVSWMLEKLWIKGIIKDKVGVNSKKILFCDHHLSHAASSYFCSPFQEAAILTADAVGEWTTATLGEARGNQIHLTHELRFPHSVGLLYSTFTAFLGYEVNEGEYKVMGMAPYGTPKYIDEIYKVVQVNDDGSIWLNMEYFSFHHSTSRMFSRKFESLFGTPRDPRERDVLDPYYADIAASIQVVTEEILLTMAKYLHRRTGLKELCMAGGVALNSVANGRILRETPFEQIYIQPSAGDGGGAIGAALYAYHTLLGQPRVFVMEHAYWGQEFTDSEVAKFVQANGLRADEMSNEDTLCERVVDSLSRGEVVGWMQGRFEFGPRALGNRSILADPRRAEMKDIVNRKIKFREPFRPFAPSVLAEATPTFFQMPNSVEQPSTRFMLLVVPVKENQRDNIPAVTHVDGTARVHVVDEGRNPLYHKLIRTFGQATGVPVVLNTSFNLKGEPIVTTPADALNTFMRSEMDLLVIGPYVLSKDNIK